MPCYNEPVEIFRRSLESVIDQTLKDIEIILILDNPRNIELQSIIEEYQKTYTNILLLTPEKNLGRGEARNLGISFAEGKYIAIHDADDIDVPERLKEQYNYMEANPEVGVVFSEIQYTDNTGNTLEISRLLELRPEHTSFFKKPMNHPTMFLRKSILDEKNIQYTNQNHSEDFELWMQLFASGINFGHIDTVHTKYLAPEKSIHNDFVQKMKDWKITSLKSLWKHRNTFQKDIYFYLRIIVILGDYISLLFGKKGFFLYRKLLRNTGKILKR